ncbi:hypothetical protein GC175_29100 [bacterium]|nr:hypothetical protein [bacterium]
MPLPTRVDPSSLVDSVHQAFKDWNVTHDTENALTSLLLFQRAAQGHPGRPPRFVLQQMLQDALASLAQEHPDDAALLRRRFIEQATAYTVANESAVSESTLYKLQASALRRLTDALCQQEAMLQETHLHGLVERLEPPTYTRLFGVDEQLDQLSEKLLAPEAPPILSIEGMGGLGKTALADALVRRLLTDRKVTEVGWVSARTHVLDLTGQIQTVSRPALEAEDLVAALHTQLLPQRSLPIPERALTELRRHLKQTPHLIVVDNLETVLDLEVLLPLLRSLASPSQFLLTARRSLQGDPAIWLHRVPHLSQENALRLIRYEGERISFPQISAAEDAELLPIYHIVGGNPLALRLVVGQIQHHGLDTFLAGLVGATGQAAENLYTYIFSSAWSILDKNSQGMLLTLGILDPGGADLEYLSRTGNLDRGEIISALDRLVSLSLVECSAGLTQRRYSLHSLTRAFLQEQVRKWQTQSPLQTAAMP